MAVAPHWKRGTAWVMYGAGPCSYVRDEQPPRCFWITVRGCFGFSLRIPKRHGRTWVRSIPNVIKYDSGPTAGA